MRLNEPTEKFKEFYGRNTEQMSKLIAEGRSPMSTAQLMTRRLELRNSDDSELRASWNDNYFDTGDGALYLPDGGLVVDYDAQALRGMTPESKLVGGALALEGYNAEGPIFSREELGKMITGRGLTLEEAQNHPIWRAFARGDKHLSRDYAGMIFADNKERFGYDTNMGVWLDSSPSDAPKMRAWLVGRTSDRSYAYGYIYLGDDGGRLVGVASETQE